MKNTLIDYKQKINQGVKYKEKILNKRNRILTYKSLKTFHGSHNIINVEYVEFRTKINKKTRKLLDHIISLDRDIDVPLSIDVDFFQHALDRDDEGNHCKTIDAAHYQYNLGYSCYEDQWIDLPRNEFVNRRYKCLEQACCVEKLKNLKKGLNPEGREYTDFDTGGYHLNN